MATTTLYSAHRICFLLQRSPKTIDDAAKALALEPVEVRDDRAFYSDEQFERIAKALQTVPMQSIPGRITSRQRVPRIT